ncbi:MAG: SidE phosphodiesterase domain-containing protein [Coxiellaceae bacterium]|nr:SidE phosphodiesterase domain-containing protein [Coxiellaceae bacterium]
MRDREILQHQAGGGEDPSALTEALLSGDYEAARELMAGTVSSHVIESEPLAEGPSQKNLALQHVEYIFQCALQCEQISVDRYGERYAPRNYEAGRPIEFALENKGDGLVIAHCPNGRHYNLSAALKHANFAYFMLQDDDHSLEMIRLCEERLGYVDGGVGNPADTLENCIEGMPVYQVEQQAIRQYSYTSFVSMNALLRAQAVELSDSKLEKTFINCLLAISGTNKNIHIKDEESKRVLTRYENEVPDEMTQRMQTANQLLLRSGLLSFSEKEINTFNKRSNKIVLQDVNASSIAGISAHPAEGEVLVQPAYLRFTSYQSNPKNTSQVYHAQVVTGVATEYVDEYFLELAMQDAFHILQQPYKEGADSRFGVARHNHALAHHVRAAILIDPVVDYFKQHAASEAFRHFCYQLTPEELQIMKVMMIFSKTGRESEASPASIKTYMRYQQASADNLARFMREHMHCDEAKIAYYCEIMINMGNPHYPSLVTGATEQEKNHKLYINHMTALAHKLDLPRVYSEDGYNHSMSGYNGEEQVGTGAVFVLASEEQKTSLEKMEVMAMSMLKATGDNLCFVKHGVERGTYDTEQFIKSNTNIDHCWKQCQCAYLKVLDRYSAQREKLDQLHRFMDDNDRVKMVQQLFGLQPNERIKFRQVFGYSVLSALIRSEHDYHLVVTSYLALIECTRADIIAAYKEAINHHKPAIALQLLPYLPADTADSRQYSAVYAEFAGVFTVFHALHYCFEYGFEQAVFDALIDKISVEDLASPHRSDALLLAAIKSDCSVALIERLMAKGCALRPAILMFAFEHDANDEVLLYFARTAPIELSNKKFFLVAAKEGRSPPIVAALSERLGKSLDPIQILLGDGMPIGILPADVIVLALLHFPSQCDAILDELSTRGYDFAGDLRSNNNVLSQAILMRAPIAMVQQLLARGARGDDSIMRLAYAEKTSHALQSLLMAHSAMTELAVETVVTYVLLCPADEQVAVLTDFIASGLDVNVCEKSPFSGIDTSNTLLYRMIYKGATIELVRILIEAGAVIAETPLHAALRSEDRVVRQYIIDNTPRDILLQLCNIREVLETATADERIAVLDGFLDAGFDINSQGRHGACLLKNAICDELPLAYIRALLERGAVITEAVIAQAVHTGNVEYVTLVLQHLESHVPGVIFEGFEPAVRLVASVPAKDQSHALDVLLANGFDPKNDGSGEYNLMGCALRNHCCIEVLVTLIDRGARVNSGNLAEFIKLHDVMDDKVEFIMQQLPADKYTPQLIVALLKLTKPGRQLDVLQRFILRGVGFGSGPQRGWSVLQYAALKKLPSPVMMAITDHVPAVSAQALQYVLEYGDYYSDEIKLMMLAKMDVPSIPVKCAMLIVKDRPADQQLDTFHLLLDKGYKIYPAVLANSERVLYQAISQGVGIDVIQALLDAGCFALGSDLKILLETDRLDVIDRLLAHIKPDSIDAYQLVEMLKKYPAERQIEILKQLRGRGHHFPSKGGNISVLGVAFSQGLSLAVIKEIVPSMERITPRDIVMASKQVVAGEYNDESLSWLFTLPDVSDLCTYDMADVLVSSPTTKDFILKVAESAGKLKGLTYQVIEKCLEWGRRYESGAEEKRQLLLTLLRQLCGQLKAQLNEVIAPHMTKTLFMHAVSCFDKEIVSVMMQSGVDVNVLNDNGDSALSIAVNAYSPVVANLLLDAIDPALIIQPNDTGKFPLIIAMAATTKQELAVSMAERCGMAEFGRALQMSDYTVVAPFLAEHMVVDAIAVDDIIALWSDDSQPDALNVLTARVIQRCELAELTTLSAAVGDKLDDALKSLLADCMAKLSGSPVALNRHRLMSASLDDVESIPADDVGPGSQDADSEYKATIA